MTSTMPGMWLIKTAKKKQKIDSPSAQFGEEYACSHCKFKNHFATMYCKENNTVNALIAHVK